MSLTLTSNKGCGVPPGRMGVGDFPPSVQSGMEATTAVLAAQQHQVDGFVLGLSKKRFESAKKNTSIRLRHKARQRLSQQFKSSATHHFEKGVITLKDDAAGVQAQITDGRPLRW